MTGHTPKWDLPYPEPADYVSDSQSVMQELATKIDLLVTLRVRAPLTEYTLTGALIATITASGTWTPPAGVSAVTVVVVGGGGSGQGGGNPDSTWYSGGEGGTGAEVVVAHLDLLDPVSVTIGGPNTASSFGSVTARQGRAQQGYRWWGAGVTPAPDPVPWYLAGSRGGAAGWRISPSTGTFAGTPGQDGVTINYGPASVILAGGGGGGGPSGPVASGGAGGGGTAGEAWGVGANATPSTGGGGGGGSGATGGGAGAGGLGGSGVVLVFTDQATMRRRNAPTPNPDPVIVAALDDNGTMTGAYAVDAAARELPDKGVRVVDYPTAPVDTGRTVTAPADPDDPAGPTVEAPVLAWPVAGWTYTESDGWKEPA